MLPIESEQPTTKFRRLMIAQDTGGAIIGPARADIYFGAGDEAGSISGRLRHPGRFVMLLPNEIDPATVDARRCRCRGQSRQPRSCKADDKAPSRRRAKQAAGQASPRPQTCEKRKHAHKREQ